jgi:hypothetical protein
MGEPEEWKRIERGWYMGDQKFRQKLLEQMEPKLGRYHAGASGRRRRTRALSTSETPRPQNLFLFLATLSRGTVSP